MPQRLPKGHLQLVEPQGFQQGRTDVDGFHQCVADGTGRYPSGPAQDQGNPQCRFVKGAFEHPAVIAGHFAVIGPEHDTEIIEPAASSIRRKDLTAPVIDECDLAIVICPDRGGDFGGQARLRLEILLLGDFVGSVAGRGGTPMAGGESAGSYIVAYFPGASHGSCGPGN